MGLAERLLSNSIAELSSTRHGVDRFNLDHLKKEENRRFVHSDATCRFNYNIFIEQFLCHLFFPLSVLYLRYKYGKTAPHNQIFSNYGVKTVFWQFISHLYWILIVVYICKRSELNSNGITDEEFVSTIMAGIIFRGMVASKYGSLSSDEYHAYLLIENHDEIIDLRIQLQLITGWMGIDVNRMKYESELAFTRLGIYRDECQIPKFNIKSQELPKWMFLLDKHSEIVKREDDGSLTIDSTDLMSVFFDISKNNVRKYIYIYISKHSVRDTQLYITRPQQIYACFYSKISRCVYIFCF